MKIQYKLRQRSAPLKPNFQISSDLVMGGCWLTGFVRVEVIYVPPEHQFNSVWIIFWN